MLWAPLPVCLRSEGPILVSMLGHSPPAACPWPPQQFRPLEHRCHVPWGSVLASGPCLSVGQTYFPRVNTKVSSAFVQSRLTPPGGLSRGPSSNCLRAVLRVAGSWPGGLKGRDLNSAYLWMPQCQACNRCPINVWRMAG